MLIWHGITLRKVLISWLGSVGPGIIPTMRTFSRLNRINRGKFITVR